MESIKCEKLDKFKHSIKYFCFLLTGDRKHANLGVAFLLKLS